MSVVRTALVAFFVTAPLACGRTGSFDSPVIEPGDSASDTSSEVPVAETGIDEGIDSAPPPDDVIFEDVPWDDVEPIDTGVDDTEPPPPDVIEFDTGIDDTIVPPDDVLPPDTGVDVGPPDTGIDVGPPDTGIDTGTDTGVDGGITCGPGAVCDSKTQDCCGGFTGFSCIPKGSPCGGPVLTCSSAASCSPGQVCCITPGGPPPPSAKCAFFCLGVQLCAKDTECPPGRKCLPVFGGLSTCR